MPDAAFPPARRLLDIPRIRVRDAALDLEVVVTPASARVDERAAHRVLAVLPNLARHVCVNGRGGFFADEIAGTELPHLLEHVVIELQGQASGSAPLTGHTSWLGAGRMRVTVGFRDDFVALRACELGRAIVEWAAGDGPGQPDAAGYVAELRSMMERL